MNDIKKLYILGIVLVAIVGIIIISETIGSQRPSKKARAFFPGITADALSAVKIADNKDTVKVMRKGDVWVVTRVKKAMAEEQKATAEGAIPETPAGQEQAAAEEVAVQDEYPVDSASIATLLEKLVTMKRDILVSKNPAKQETFEVDSAHGVLVEVWNAKGKSIGTFRIGKSGPDWSSNYVRTPGSNDVWAVSGSIKSAFFADLKRWRDKTIVKFEPSSVKTLTLTKKDTVSGVISTWSMERATDSLNNAVWTFTVPAGITAKSEEIEKIAEKLSKFKTADWEEDPAVSDSARGFLSPYLVVEAKLTNGETKKVVFGAKQSSGGKWYVKAEGKEDVFLVYEYSMRDFDKKLEDISNAPAPVITAEHGKEEKKAGRKKGKKK